jgi:soluble lytic murein transglycosylase-like protein
MAVATALLFPTARAAERLTLRNGFDIRCDHHAQAGDHARVYLNAGEDSYFEIPSADIVRAEPLGDPLRPPEPAQSAQKAGTAGAADAQLSPADLDEMLARAGKVHNLDVDLLASVVKAESGGNTHAVSRAGARGLMQLMPATASNLGVQDRDQPDDNVRGGSAYLDALLTQYHENLALALAAYNAGPAAVDKYRGIPPYRETRAYVARVIHEFNRRIRAREALPQHAVASATKPLAH